MRSVGTILRSGRKGAGKSLREVSRQTKIKEKFLQALEADDYSSLPNLAVASGFAKSYAKVVGQNPDFIAAVLRRDFPVAEEMKKPFEMSLLPGTIWTPKLTVVAFSLLVGIILAGFLARQYLNFYQAPELVVSSPAEGEEIKSPQLTVSGRTDPEATIKVNGQQVLVSGDGSFTIQTFVTEATDYIEIQAVSRGGRGKTVRRQIITPN